MAVLFNSVKEAAFWNYVVTVEGQLPKEDDYFDDDSLSDIEDDDEEDGAL